MTYAETIALIEAAVHDATDVPVKRAGNVGGVEGATITVTPYTGPHGDGWTIRAAWRGLVRVKVLGPETQRERPWPSLQAAVSAALGALWNSLSVDQKRMLASDFATIRALREAREFDTLFATVQALAAALPVELTDPQTALKNNILAFIEA